MTRPIDKGWAWVILAAGWWLNCLIAGTNRSSGILLGIISEHFHRNKQDTSWISGITSTVFLSMIPVSLILSQKTNCRLIILIGSFFVSFGYFISVFAPCLEFLYFSIGVLNGIGLGFTVMPVVLLVSTYFDKKRTLAVGIVGSGCSMGSLTIPPLINYLVNEFSYRGCMLILSGILLNQFVLGCLMRPLSFYDSEKTLEIVQNDVTSCSDYQKLLSHNDADLHVHNNFKSINDITVNSIHVHTNMNDTLQNSQIEPFLSYHSLNKPEESATNQNMVLRKTKSAIELSPEVVYKEDCIKENLIAEVPIFSMSSNYGSVLAINSDEKSENGCSINLPISDSQQIKENNFCARLTNWNTSLFKQAGFYLLIIPTALSSYGIFCNFLILPQHALDLNMSDSFAASLMQIQGVSDFVMRVATGLVTDYIHVSKRYIYTAMTILQAATWMVLAFTPSFAGLLAFSIFIGGFGGSAVTLKSLMYIEAFGLENFPTSFGFSSIVEATFYLCVPSFLGRFKDSTDSWNTSIQIVACGLFLCSFCLLIDPVCRRITKFIKNAKFIVVNDDKFCT